MQEAMSLALNSLLCLPMDTKFEPIGDSIFYWKRSLADKDEFENMRLAKKANMQTFSQMASGGAVSYEQGWAIFGMLAFNVVERGTPTQMKALMDAATTPADPDSRDTITLSKSGIPADDLQFFAANYSAVGPVVSGLPRVPGGNQPYPEAFEDLIPVPIANVPLEGTLKLMRLILDWRFGSRP